MGRARRGQLHHHQIKAENLHVCDVFAPLTINIDLECVTRRLALLASRASYANNGHNCDFDLYAARARNVEISPIARFVVLRRG